MPTDYYPNKSQEELITILNGLQQRQLKGGITEVSAAGVRTTRDFGRNALMSSRVSTEILRVLYSLHLGEVVAAGQVAQWPDPYAGKVTRTRARYTFS
jgi:hypothetical protein